MTITERAAYIKGLAEGLAVHQTGFSSAKPPCDVILRALVLRLREEPLRVVALDELTEQVETIDEDLGSLEEDYYDLDDECDCDECGAEDFEDGDIYEVCCPTCGDIVCIDSDMLEEGQTTCPNCGELLEFDLEDDGEETEDSDNDDK